MAPLVIAARDAAIASLSELLGDRLSTGELVRQQHGRDVLLSSLYAANEHLRKLGLTVSAFLCIPAHQSRLGDNVTLHCGVDDVTFRFWRQTYARVERV